MADEWKPGDEGYGGVDDDGVYAFGYYRTPIRACASMYIITANCSGDKVYFVDYLYILHGLAWIFGEYAIESGVYVPPEEPVVNDGTLHFKSDADA